jgi:DNA-binding XRE family transcriptional regulator
MTRGVSFGAQTCVTRIAALGYSGVVMTRPRRPRRLLSREHTREVGKVARLLDRRLLVEQDRTHELRKAKGWSQNKLADFAGIARGYLSHILAGEYSPTIRILAQLADALEVQVKDLFL